MLGVNYLAHRYELGDGGEYDEYDLLAYYCDVGPPPPIHYSAVEITEVEANGDPLTGAEHFVRHDDLMPRTRIMANSPADYDTYQYGPPRRNLTDWRTVDDGDVFKRHVVDMIRGKLMNPPNGAVVYHNDSFDLRMCSHHSLRDTESWVFFGCKDLDVWCGPQTQRVSLKAVSEGGEAEYTKFKSQHYRLALKTGVRHGFLQFFQGARYGAKTSKGLLPYGELKTIFIYRTTERHVNQRNYPPLVPVVPTSHQTYVPLLPDQTLQVIMPDTYNINYSDNGGFQGIKAIGAYHTAMDKICTYFQCNFTPTQIFPIFLEARDASRQGVVIIPPIHRHRDGVYAVVHNPLEGIELYTNGVDGFIFRTTQNLFENHHHFLDKQHKLNIESKQRYMSPNSIYEAYDVRLRIMDKSKRKIQITNLRDPDVCKVS